MNLNIQSDVLQRRVFKKGHALTFRLRCHVKCLSGGMAVKWKYV